jgi:hypothetical protein
MPVLPKAVCRRVVGTGDGIIAGNCARAGRDTPMRRGQEPVPLNPVFLPARAVSLQQQEGAGQHGLVRAAQRTIGLTLLLL